ncbi:histidine kinase [Pseudonocardia sp. ICBG1293]|uniref:sensor histidine kinase n=1 Tax=Pseudonocardia sp. ICBG1293 TaxID=2844382 RepID=UPI001CCCBF1F|nr:histidine kinase [Pseudonocardia sp. ICBG1293]
MPVRPAVISALLVAAVLAAGLTVAETQATAGVLQWALLAAGLASIAGIPWRYRFPRVFAVLAVLGPVVSPIATYLPLVGVFVIATRRRAVETLPVLALAVGAAAFTLYRNVPDGWTVLVLLGGAVAFQAVSVTAGLLTGIRRAMVDDLRERLDRAEAERALREDQARADERRRIAGEMHDRLGHRLSLLSVHAGALALRGDLPASTVRETARVLSDTTHRAMEDLRTIVQVLHEPAGDVPNEVDDLGAVAALVVEARGVGVDVGLRSTELLTLAPPGRPLAGVAHRVVREGLTNAARHAPGARVEVVLDGRPGAELTVTVRCGPSIAGPASGGARTGLVGLRERVETLTGGTLTHGTTPSGHVLRAVLPWPTERT